MAWEKKHSKQSENHPNRIINRMLDIHTVIFAKHSQGSFFFNKEVSTIVTCYLATLMTTGKCLE